MIYLFILIDVFCCFLSQIALIYYNLFLLCDIQMSFLPFSIFFIVYIDPFLSLSLSSQYFGAPSHRSLLNSSLLSDSPFDWSTVSSSLVLSYPCLSSPSSFCLISVVSRCSLLNFPLYLNFSPSSSFPMSICPFSSFPSARVISPSFSFIIPRLLLRLYLHHNT